LLSCEATSASVLFSNFAGGATAEFSADNDDQAPPFASSGSQNGLLSASISGTSVVGNTSATANASLSSAMNSSSSIRLYGSAFASAATGVADGHPYGFARGTAGYEFDVFLSEPTEVMFTGGLINDLHAGDGMKTPPFRWAETPGYWIGVEASGGDMWGIAASYGTETVLPVPGGWLPLPLQSDLYHFTMTFSATSESITTGDFGSALVNYDVTVEFSTVPEPALVIPLFAAVVLIPWPRARGV